MPGLMYSLDLVMDDNQYIILNDYLLHKMI